MQYWPNMDGLMFSSQGRFDHSGSKNIRYTNENFINDVLAMCWPINNLTKTEIVTQKRCIQLIEVTGYNNDQITILIYNYIQIMR